MKLLHYLHSILLFNAIYDGSCASRMATRGDCVCGEANIVNSGRIVNGVKTTPHKYPWMAAMFSARHRVVCGGSVISTRNIITAGHCYFYNQSPYSSYWILGMHKNDESSGEKYLTQKFELHPRFINNSNADDFDMALVTVDKPIEFSKFVSPICLVMSNLDYYVDKQVTVAGWGRVEENNSKPAAQLMETTVIVKDQQECTEKTKELAFFNPESMICAHRKLTDACQGDSGGPIFFESEPNRHELIGVVSFGYGCARDFPGVYGRTTDANTVLWIQRAIKRTGGEVCSDPPRLRRRIFYPMAYAPVVDPYYPIVSPAIVYG